MGNYRFSLLRNQNQDINGGRGCEGQPTVSEEIQAILQNLTSLKTLFLSPTYKMPSSSETASLLVNSNDSNTLDLSYCSLTHQTRTQNLNHTHPCFI